MFNQYVCFFVVVLLLLFQLFYIKQIIIFFVQIMSWIKLKYLLNVFFFIDNV